MSFIKTIEKSLNDYAAYVGVGSDVAVPTHCLYPSNKVVSVMISGGPRECVVSDNGGAISELTTSGLLLSNKDGHFAHIKDLCKDRGVKFSQGQVVSPPVPIEGLVSALVMVANASKDIANWGIQSIKPRRKRNMRSEVSRILGRHFSADQISALEHVTGASTRRYPVDWVVRVDSAWRLLVDVVLPEPSSINAKAIAHMDIHGLQGKKNDLGDVKFESVLTYDADDEWKSSDLSLLQMAGKLVPMSALEKSLGKFTRV